LYRNNRISEEKGAQYYIDEQLIEESRIKFAVFTDSINENY